MFWTRKSIILIASTLNLFYPQEFLTPIEEQQGETNKKRPNKMKKTYTTIHSHTKRFHNSTTSSIHRFGLAKLPIRVLETLAHLSVYKEAINERICLGNLSKNLSSESAAKTDPHPMELTGRYDDFSPLIRGTFQSSSPNETTTACRRKTPPPTHPAVALSSKTGRNSPPRARR